MYFLFVSTLVWLVSGPVLYIQFRRRLLDDARQNDAVMLEKVSKGVMAVLGEVASITDQLSLNVDLEEFPAQMNRMDITGMRKTSDHLQDIAILRGFRLSVDVFYPGLQAVLSTDSGYVAVARHADRTFLASLSPAGSSASWIARWPQWSDSCLLTMVRTIPMTTTDPLGYIVTDVHTSYLLELVNAMNPPASRLIAISDGSGKILFASRDGNIVPEAGVPSIARQPAQPVTSTASRTKLRGSEALVASSAMGDLGWNIWMFTPLSETLAGISVVRFFFLENIIVSLLICAVMAYLLARRMNRPIEEIAKAARVELAEGTGQDDILTTIRRAMNSVMEENTALQARLEEQLPIVRNSFLNQALHSPWQFRRTLAGRMSYYGIPTGLFDSFVVVLFAYTPRSTMPEDGKVLLCARMDALSASLPGLSGGVGITLVDGDADFALAMPCPESGPDALRPVIGEIVKVLHSDGISLSASAGAVHRSFFELPEAFRQAKIALARASFHATHDIAIYATTDTLEPSWFPMMLDVEESLVSALREMDRDMVLGVLDTILAALPASRGDGVRPLFPFTAQFLAVFMRVLHRMGVEPSRAFGARDLFAEGAELTEPGQFSAFLTSILDETIAFLRNRIEHGRNMEKMEKLKLYIREHPDADLSLKALSDKVYMSVPYLSRTFREVAGVPLKSYINDCRVARAKELLRNPDKKVLDVAKAVGYEKVHAFIKLFKSATSQTPSEYREMVVFTDRA